MSSPPITKWKVFFILPVILILLSTASCRKITTQIQDGKSKWEFYNLTPAELDAAEARIKMSESNQVSDDNQKDTSRKVNKQPRRLMTADLWLPNHSFDLCGTYSMTLIGDSWNTTINNLAAGFINTLDNHVIIVGWSATCTTISVWKYGTATAASNFLVESFNYARLDTQSGLNSGQVTPNEASVLADLKEQFQEELWYHAPGSVFSSTACQNVAAVNNAHYVNAAGKCQ